MSYIKGELQKGTPDGIIKQNLLASGWNENEINEAMVVARASLPPQTQSSFQPMEMLETTRTVFSVVSILRGLIVAVFFFFFGFLLLFSPLLWFFGAFIILIGFIIIVATVISIVKSQKVEERYSPARQVFTGPQPTFTNEYVVGYVPGIMRFVQRRRSYGIGEYPPENAMIFTNRRLIFVVVPISTDSSSSWPGALIPSWQWATKSNEVRSGLEQMIKTMSIEEILWQDSRNFYLPYVEIKKIDVGKISMTIKIVKKDGMKLVYAVREKKDMERAREIVEKLAGNFQ